jgi:5'-3' exonuclease
MGIKQFFKLFNGNEIQLSDLSGSTIAIDAMTEIYRASLGVPNVNTLNAPDGKPTAHINIILHTVSKMKRLNIKQIFVFDSEIPPPEKIKELKRRQECKSKTTDTKRSFSVTPAMISEVKFVIHNLGVDYINTPDGYDAEHICALLNKHGRVDHILTTDADTFMYGGLSILKWEKRKLIQYTREELIKTTNLNESQLLRLGVCMGTDFCDKTPRVGIKTVVKKCINIELTDDQKNAITIFQGSPDIPSTILGNFDNSTLSYFLELKGFNRKRIEQII